MSISIISGAAGTGKTTLINTIERSGVLTMPEASRQVIIDEQKYGREGMPWKNVERFSELVFQKKLDHLREYSEAIFCDRSIIDTIAYLRFQEKPVPDYLTSFPFHRYYKKEVFFALPWKEIYTKDPQRPESFSYQQQLSPVLEKTYLDYGFEIVYLPFTSVQSRLDFVLNKVCLPTKIK
ncbi:AAA family ATPase [Flammeovirga agarivorans]|uniref:AAA family ATPase n=1 Tax=Flammeovirga agarivorans TaxID=2726742 RepID=A0A7X8SMK2_9BACT|nr:AAA family ATPase [Flammeovirga agarivorans]NLR92983.1 AAA family ATPase [Flammeovirga agarivorans]